jgi:2-dehydropantoate 2-reductase
LRFAVLGAGAIGSLIGGLLSEAGSDVTLVGRAPHMNAIKSKGLHISGDSGEKTIRVKAETTTSAIKGTADIILCTVKAYDTRQAAIDAKRLMGKESLFLCLQNGLDVEKEAADILGDINVARGITNNGALIVRPGYVKHTGLGETTIGCRDARWRMITKCIVESFNIAGLPATLTEDIERLVWLKVLVNSGINALGAITHLKNGELLSNPWLKDLMRSTITEGIMVAKKVGIDLRNEDIVERTYKIAEGTAVNKNSMLQDVEKGKRTEIDFINGAVGRIGRNVGVPTPINDTLTALVKSMEPCTTSQ